MASFTRKAIMDSFMKLVDQRPISKITIKDIVEDCGVNRNTHACSCDPERPTGAFAALHEIRNDH